MIREMQKCLLTTITAASMLAIATPARAQTLMEIGPEVNYADKCFSRSYSAQHLNAKSRQLVTRIALAALDRGVEGPQLFPNESEFLIAVQTRLGRGWHSRIAICSVGSNDMMNCAIESDGGNFSIQNRSDGSVMIRTRREIRVGDDQGPEIGGSFSDDNAFILQPAACRRAR